MDHNAGHHEHHEGHEGHDEHEEHHGEHEEHAKHDEHHGEHHKHNHTHKGRMIELKQSLLWHIFSRSQPKVKIHSHTREIIAPNSHIRSIPAANLIKYLETINLDNNDLEALPYFPLLCKATLRYNKLRSFPECPHLTTLDLTHNKLRWLPPNLPNLVHLYCAINELSEIPFYPKLIYLNCAWNNLREIPKFPDLKFLNISCNRIKTLPFYENLTTLWAKGNKKIFICNNMPMLKALDCSHCALRHLPYGRKIRYFNCSNNKIKELTLSSKSLHYLDCSNNRITRLPDEIPGIRYLKCYGNKLDERVFKILLQVEVYETAKGHYYYDPDNTKLKY